TTALVAATVEPSPHLDVVAAWSPDPGDRDYRIPVGEVEDTIRAACKRWAVRRIVADPYRWERSLQVLEAEGLPVVAFPQSPQRLIPATSRFYEAVTSRGLTHSS